MIKPDPTIAAIATAAGQAGVAIIRLSGPNSWPIATRLLQRTRPLQANQIGYGWVHDPTTGDRIDEVVVLPFQAPRSFTGEDVVELHCHGGQLMPQRILSLCLEAGAQPAGPGEFTRRAFLAGKLDLTQAEAIADLIAAESDGLARAASHQLSSRGLAQRLERIREGVLPIVADIVASTDYPEEVDEPDRTGLIAQLDSLYQQAEALRLASTHNRILRDGFKVALLGQPNAGKSSLFNQLLAQDRAIVTPVAGTTRDTLTETLTVAGVAVTLIDTAGLRETADQVEILGIERSLDAAQSANAIFYLVDASACIDGQLSLEDQRLLAQLPTSVPRLLLATKADLAQHAPLSDWVWSGKPESFLSLSVKTGEGLVDLWQWLTRQVSDNLALTQGQDRWITLNHRQTQCLEAALSHLHQAKISLGQPSIPIDLVTVPLMDAMAQLDALTGRDTTETVLDDVFSRFCVGK